jgi:hypothetical protein
MPKWWSSKAFEAKSRGASGHASEARGLAFTSLDAWAM